VSAILSPLETEHDLVFSIPMQFPPKRFIDVSKDNLVLVDGSKNINPRILPFNSSQHSFDLAISSSFDASSRI